VKSWREALASCDGLLIACPEYGHSLPGALKNGTDWVIGTGELHRKSVAITAAVGSPERGRRGLGALKQTLLAVDARIVRDEPVVRGENDRVAIEALVEELCGQLATTDLD
jgi:NAD(P)H-dependent FMN reductase